MPSPYRRTYKSHHMKLSAITYQLFYDIPDRDLYIDCYELKHADYQRKIDNSLLINYYREVLNYYKKLILKVAANPFIASIADIDSFGNNFESFSSNCDLLAFRDGGVYVDVSDKSKLTVVTNRAIQSTSKGKVKYTTARKETVEIKEADLVPYFYNQGITEHNGWEFVPLFAPVAYVNMALFQAQTEYDALCDLYGNPVLVRIDDSGLAINAGNSRGHINFRERNRIVDLNVGGEAYFLGLTEVNAAVLLGRIERFTSFLEAQLRTLHSPSAVAKSATEVQLEADLITLNFSDLAPLKEANMKRILAAWLARHYPNLINYANDVYIESDAVVSEVSDGS